MFQQRRALWGFLVGSVTLAVNTAIITATGAANYTASDPVRITVSIIFVAGLLAYALIVPFGLYKARSGGGLDERDVGVLARAPALQQAAIIVALVTWLIVLTERYHDQGAVPIVYLNLIFGSIVIISLIAHAAGILLGYWLSARRYGQG